ncbi:MAG: hypothetical protein HFH54_01685 [Lachnospiraceae bacterium]|nr:hypothetical protein [Lachnospiraceae bacterium]
MSNPRRVKANLKFNGKWLGKSLKNYLESVTYTDIASGESDQLDIVLQNIDMGWLGKKYPKKGDRVDGTITFVNWDSILDKKLDCGAFVLDDVKFSGGPLTANFGCIASPIDSSFNTRERTKTYKDVTIGEIAQEIADKYDLELKCSDADIRVGIIEQSQKTDSAFLYDLCGTYGLSMKVYKKAIVIYDQTVMEEKKPVAKLTRESFIDDKWDYTDALIGVYTGARISYKPGDGSEEISVYVGEKDEEAKDARVLHVNETADSVSDAYFKAAVAVNKSNQEATKLSGDIWPDIKICAGVTVKVTGFGKPDGKYFVDKCVTEIGGSRSRQTIEMHKCQERLPRGPEPEEG